MPSPLRVWGERRHSAKSPKWVVVSNWRTIAKDVPAVLIGPPVLFLNHACCAVVGLVFTLAMLCPGWGWAEEPTHYPQQDGYILVPGPNPDLDPSKAYDFYLSGDRICKQCHWQWVSAETLRLTNRDGLSGLYPVNDVIGVETEAPWKRRVLKHMLYNVNPTAARTIVPQAFDNEARLAYP